MGLRRPCVRGSVALKIKFSEHKGEIQMRFCDKCLKSPKT
jgi:hypothetical protein